MPKVVDHIRQWPVQPLRKRAEFQSVARSGRRAFSYGLVLQAMERGVGEKEGVRVGFTVSKKVGKAVVRNRVKRRLRAVVREVFPYCAQSGYDYVVIARKEAFLRSYQELLGDMRYTLKKIHDGGQR